MLVRIVVRLGVRGELLVLKVLIKVIVFLHSYINFLETKWVLINERELFD